MSMRLLMGSKRQARACTGDDCLPSETETESIGHT
jgi:hypothetical protein